MKMITRKHLVLPHYKTHINLMNHLSSQYLRKTSIYIINSTMGYFQIVRPYNKKTIIIFCKIYLQLGDHMKIQFKDKIKIHQKRKTIKLNQENKTNMNNILVVNITRMIITKKSLVNDYIISIN